MGHLKMPFSVLNHESYILMVLYILITFTPLSLKASDNEYDGIVDIDIGQSEIVHHKNISRIAVGSGKIVSVKTLQDSGQILLIGKKSGITDLRIWEKNKSQTHYLVRVTDQGKEVQLKQLQNYIGDIKGIEISQLGSQIIINGSGLRNTEIEKINILTQEYNNVSSYVSAGGITPESMIHMDVKVVEIKKNELKKIGINWSDVINGPEYALMNDYQTNSVFRPKAGFETGNNLNLPNNIGRHNPYFGISTNLTSIVNLMANEGIARMLAEPQLSCKSGGKAEFLAGGEVPLPVRDKNGSASVKFKQYGIILKIEPVASSDGYISTHVSVEISTIDDTLKVMDIPGFLTRKTETDMNVKEGETMVISGLVNSDAAKAVDKLPGLGNIPILGELFKSRSFRSNETEMIILVTPHIIDPSHKINQAWIERAKKIESLSNNDLGFKLLD